MHNVGSEVFSQFFLRWLHILSAITWMGLLYYFNFVQVPAFAEMEPAERSGAIRKLVPKALWYFRWAAALTVLTGVLILAIGTEYHAKSFWQGGPAAGLSAAILFALIMLGNVWMVIWPNQRIVIASTEAVAAGGEADPNQPAAGRKALLASRTNALMSIPVGFFMVATTHAAPFLNSASATNRGIWYAIVAVIAVVLELNALGIIAGTGPGPTKKALETVRAVIVSGFVLLAVMFAIFLLLFTQS